MASLDVFIAKMLQEQAMQSSAGSGGASSQDSNISGDDSGDDGPGLFIEDNGYSVFTPIQSLVKEGSTDEMPETFLEGPLSFLVSLENAQGIPELNLEAASPFADRHSLHGNSFLYPKTGILS